MSQIYRLARNTKGLTDATVIKLLKAAVDPKIISFAGGVPSPKTFPLKKFNQVSRRLFNNPLAFQYQPTQGINELLEILSSYLTAKWQRQIKPENILITSGSQQAIDLLGKALIDKGNKILVERPTYFVALQAFSAYQPCFQEVILHNEQVSFKNLTRFLKQKPKIFYLNPSFQNPTGQSLTLKQRQELVNLAAQFPQTLFIEDAAYTDLFFDKAYPDLISFSPKIIHLGTFSKTLAPGLRIGYLVGPKELIYQLTLIKQSLDLHTNSLSQLMVNELLREKKWFAKHLSKIRKFYYHQAEIMGKTLTKLMPKSVSWQQPQGGLFYWLKTAVDTRKLYLQAIKRGVAFIPGHVFFAARPEFNYLRLSFATVDNKKMKKGLVILSSLLT